MRWPCLHLVGEMSADDEFIRTGRGLRDGLGKRAGLDERCQRLSGELQTLKGIMTAWPGAAQVIQGKQTELAGVIQDLDSLETELKNAKKRSQAEQLRAAHTRLTQAKAEWKQAADRLAESKPVPADLLAELKRLDPEIDKLRIQIAAQKLTANLESSSPISLQVQRGTSAPESITLSPSDPWENQAEGIFRLEYHDLKLSVESGTGDVNALFTRLETARQRQTEILTTLGHESLAAAQLADTTRQKLITEENNQKNLHQAALQGRTEEEWAADMAALADLPETRSIDVLETEKTARLSRKASLEFEIRQEQEKIAKWTTDHTDLDSLTDKILTKTAELNEAKQELAGLPALPDGFASIPGYLDLLRAKETIREKHDEALKNLKIEQGRLTGTAPDATADDLRADLEIKQRDFERQQSEGQALLRIQSKLQSVIAARGIDDPMQGLATAVSNHFRHLTAGRYEEVTLDGPAPSQVGGTLTMETALLSQGTLGSLALATRLALSELYLKDMPGFLLLDDPFTDMDTTRRAAAIQALGAFAANHQVLIFTCHPEHAGELQTLAGAKAFQVTR